MVLTRRLVQLAFVILTVVGVFVIQGHAERWCPLGGVEAAYQYLREGNLLCSLGVSNFFMLGAVLLLALLARRAFCGYACPIGAVTEWLQAGARRFGLRPWRVPAGLERGLGLLKYVVLGVILYFTWRVGELVFRGYDPCYALISRNGTDITVWAYVISGGILLGSAFVSVPFCRWLCPLAAVFAPFSRFGVMRVRRHTDVCTDCGHCEKACPMAIPVDKLPQVTVAHCTSCLDCVAACPLGPHRPKGKVRPALTWGPPGSTRRWPQAVAIGLVLGCLGTGVAATFLFPLPSFVRTFGTPGEQTETLRLTVLGVHCRHSTEQFVEHIVQRDDEYAVPGFLKIEAWPQPDGGAVQITFDPAQTSATTIRHAIVGASFDAKAKRWLMAPYRIVGYDPLEDQD